MSEAHFDEFEHYNFDQDKAMRSGHSGKGNFWNQNCPFTSLLYKYLCMPLGSLLSAINSRCYNIASDKRLQIRERITHETLHSIDHWRRPSVTWHVNSLDFVWFDCLREAANKEGGVDEHKQAQPGGAREEDRDEADERREEQLEQGRAASGGRQLKKLNPFFSIHKAELIWHYSARSTAKVVLQVMKESKNLNSWRLCYWAFFMISI